jgi:SAM-dependent methyltransferase
MKHPERWQPSKFVTRRGALSVSHDPVQLGVSSRLAAHLVAQCYDRYLGQHARGRLLDLGCGKVPLYAAYRAFVGDVICVDWEDSEHIDLCVDLCAALPFADEEFNTIVLSDVLEHVPTPESLWREMSRVLSPRGKIIVNVPFYYWLHGQPHDYYRYTEFALNRFVREAGLTMVTLERLGGAPEIVVDILAKHLVRIPGAGVPLAIAAQSLCLLGRRSRLWGRLFDRTGPEFPFGYFLIAEKPG